MSEFKSIAGSLFEKAKENAELILAAASALASYWQSQSLHKEATNLSKVQYSLEASLDFKQQFMSMDADLISAIKESERDMVTLTLAPALYPTHFHFITPFQALTLY